ncbi:MAG TPA: SDR family oxidoreductase [Jatrophihabitans sp.]|nr:SDR family oxidoreductase [Jatrophihabitans sp.]
MRIAGAVIAITGAGSGIGAELARRFAAEGAEHLVLTDRDEAAVAELAGRLGPVAEARRLDVTDEAAVTGCVAEVLAAHGRIDLFCSNAGVATGAGLDADPATWQLAWDVHVLAHVYAARAVVPAMIERGAGYLLNTASAAGLLSAPGDAPYSVTKHASVALAEWLAYQYAGRNIKVSVLCPMGVDTPLLMDGLAAGQPAARAVAASAEVISVAEVADAVVRGLAEESFLILPHPRVGKFWAGKAAGIDHWLAGMAQLAEQAGTTDPNDRAERT